MPLDIESHIHARLEGEALALVATASIYTLQILKQIAEERKDEMDEIEKNYAASLERVQEEYAKDLAGPQQPLPRSMLQKAVRLFTSA